MVVKLHFKNVKVYIVCLYIPSGSPISVYCNYLHALEKVIDFLDVSIQDQLYILGDFNMSEVCWLPTTDDFTISPDDLNTSIKESNVLIPCNIDTSANADFLYYLLSAGLNQVNGVSNFQGRVLDLVFCSNPSDVSVSKSDFPMVKIDSFHDPIEIEFTVETDDVIEYNPIEHEFNFRKARYDELNTYLASINWEEEFSTHTDVDAIVDRFYELLTIGFKQFVPIKKKVSSHHPPWYSKNLLNLKNRRNRAHKRYKDSNETSDYIKFCSLRNQFDSAQWRAYRAYLENIELNLINDPTKFWSYVNTMKRTVGYPSLMHRGRSNQTTTMQGKCDLFAEFFRSVYVTDVGPDVHSFGLRARVDIGSLFLNKDQVLKALNSVDTTKGDGPDNISPLLLKTCSDTLSTPLLYIFNLSLESNFPSRWKESYIVPIFKTGSRSDVECYRGVAILPTFGKLFESVVCDILTEKFRDIISIRQHGFMKGRSTATNLVDFVNETIRVIEKGNQVDTIYTDIRKAFDRILHRLLLGKLRELGVHSSLLQWIQSYLSGRTQYVKIMGWKSQHFDVSSGIPQGSHLGPLLFLIFFNDVTAVMKSSSCSLFADDLKMYKEVRTFKDCLELQRDLNALSIWCSTNSLELNIGKCVTLSFHRKINPVRFEYEIDMVVLRRVTEMKDLGVIFTEDLCFNRHIDLIVAKAYSMLGFVKRVCRDFHNIDALKSVYYAHVRSHLEYASVVWSPYYQKHNDKIESIQKKFLIYALRRTVQRDRNYRLPPYVSRCESIGMEPLWRRRFNLSAMFVFDLLRGRICAPQLLLKLQLNEPVRVLRRVNYLTLVRHRTNYGMFEPINNLSRIFNMFAHLYDLQVTRNAFRLAVKTLNLTDSILRNHGFLLHAN